MPDLNEAQRRTVAGALYLQLGRGELENVCRMMKLSRATVIKGKKEVLSGNPLNTERVRRKGAGRRPLEATDRKMVAVFRRLVEENTAGSPMAHLVWTHKSTRTLAAEMTHLGHPMSCATAARLLREMDYSLQSNRKDREGFSPPERDRQFRYINRKVTEFQERGNPVLSVDTKKRELVGNFKNAGRTYRPKGKPVEVNTYDFRYLGEGVAIPYGAYDVNGNEGFVSVGITHDTAEFAVETLRWWWKRYGGRAYTDSTGLLICADGGGSNGSRTHAWKYHLQRLSGEIGIPVTVCHYPPGTSKWNRIEHRLFSYISMNWQGKPLETYRTVVNLIGATTNRSGLRVHARLDRRKYENGERIDGTTMKHLNIRPHRTLPQWNYTIMPSG